MADDEASGPGRSGDLPVSQFSDTLHHLLSPNLLAAPGRPGVAGRMGRYEILRVLGRGGMGVVLLARDADSDRSVALKLLREEWVGHPRARQRFTAEAEHMRHLEHPGIVRVLETGVQAGVPWFAMPYFAGGSLALRLERGEPVERGELLRIAQTVAGALDHAHRRGIIHRDLKPANVLLGVDGTVCVADFGLARTLFNDGVCDPHHGPGEGTVPYMSPAVARGEAEDTRCDIYSFGALLYEMLAGRAPYQGENTAAILDAVRAGPPPAIRMLNPKADVGLVRVAEAAMARELRDRYAQMADVAADLERLAAGQAPVGPRASRGVEGWRLRVVNRRSMVGGALLALLGAGLWLWSASRPALVLKQRLVLPQVATWRGAQVANLDADATPDFVIPEGEELRMVSGRGELLFQPWRLREPRTSPVPEFSGCADVDGDGTDDLFLGWANGDTATLAPVNLNGFPLKRFTWRNSTFVHPEYGPDWTRLRREALVDLEGDGRRELLVAASTDRGNEPRALICYDFESQRLSWQQTMAPHIVKVVTADIDGDGRQEVLVGTRAPGNGNALADGTDDEHSYLYAFSEAGELLWRLEGGGLFSETLPVVSGEVHDPRVVYARSYALGHLQTEGEQEFGRILRLDSRGNVLARWENDRAIVDCAAVDLDGDDQLDLLATDLSGRICLLDGDLRLRREVRVSAGRFAGAHLHIGGVTNLTRRAGRQVVVAGGEFELLRPVRGSDRREVALNFHRAVKVWVLDEQLTVQADRLMGDRLVLGHQNPLRLLDLDGDQLPEIVFVCDDQRVFKYRAGLF